MTDNTKYEVNRRYPLVSGSRPVSGETMVAVWLEGGSISSNKAKQFVWYGGMVTHFMVLEYPPEKHVRWINVYDNVNVVGYGAFYKTREEADEYACRGRTESIKVEYLDGEGL